MSVNLYEGFTNEITGETFRCIFFSKGAYSFEWFVQPNGYVPFEHIHLNQDEVFVVKEGEMRIVLEGKEHIVGEGESFTVPKGQRHIANNNKPELLHCIVEYVPGLDAYTFYQCFGGLIKDKDLSKNGTVNISKMLYFARRMKTKSMARPTKIPAPLFHLAIHFSYITGTLRGWNRLFKKYTGYK